MLIPWGYFHSSGNDQSGACLPSHRRCQNLLHEVRRQLLCLEDVLGNHREPQGPRLALRGLPLIADFQQEGCRAYKVGQRLPRLFQIVYSQVTSLSPVIRPVCNGEVVTIRQYALRHTEMIIHKRRVNVSLMANKSGKQSE
jgi:hypothetical protein